METILGCKMIELYMISTLKSDLRTGLTGICIKTSLSTKSKALRLQRYCSHKAFFNIVFIPAGEWALL